MLPFRLGIFVGVAALCLWGLFSLLDSLKEPGLLRTDKATVVKGCDSLDSNEAQQQCPVLFCQKALLDAKQAPLQAAFEMTIDTPRDDGQRLLAGTATADGNVSYFVCAMSALKVTEAQRIGQEEYEELTVDIDN
ncbi:hypothetical protein [Povalibacter sp.]|uniref:hypothetical protein n=1 Tax=Povalibacter sp. TaxID=1962978 RepID=UPI002F404A32